LSFCWWKSVLLFVAIDKNGKVTQETENGTDPENGKYYELHDFDGVVDSYNYRITAEGVDQSWELMGKKKTQAINSTDFKSKMIKIYLKAKKT
jgi:hypothetical protein